MSQSNKPLPTRPKHIKLIGPVCNCQPPKLSVLKQVVESTTNFGAFYYKCPSETNPCKFFKWATDSGQSIDYGDLWAPCCLVHPKRKCKLLQIARNSIDRGKLFWICGVLDKPCKYYKLFEGDIDEYREFVPVYDESLSESQEKEIELVPIEMSESNSKNLLVSQLPVEIMSEILKYLEMIPNWLKLIRICKEWKRMIDLIIDEKVRNGKIDLNLGFLDSQSPFSYFCEIFKRFYKVRKITICNFELYSELMRLLEWIGVETMILFNCSTKMSITQKSYVTDNEKSIAKCETFNFRSICTELSFFHIHDDTLLYNFNPDHVHLKLYNKNLKIYQEFIKEMEKKVDNSQRRKFQELTQIIAINCNNLSFVWLNGPDARSYYSHEKLEGNYGDLVDLPFEQEELEIIGKCGIDVYHLPTRIQIGFLNVTVLDGGKPMIRVLNGTKYGYPTIVSNQVISHSEIQKQFIRNCGISNYFNKNLIKQDNFEIAIDCGILTVEEIFKNQYFKSLFELFRRTMTETGNFDIRYLWRKACCKKLVHLIHLMHLKGLVQQSIPTSIIQTTKSVDSHWRKLNYLQSSNFQVDYEGNVGAIRIPFSWEFFMKFGELKFLYSNEVVTEKNHRRTSDQFSLDSNNQSKKRKLSNNNNLQ